MAEGADVTIKYEFLPTENSIRESAERVVKKLEVVASKQKWGSGIYSEAYHKRINDVMKDSVGKVGNEYKKTTSGIINLLRAFQQKTSLQTKLLSLMKFLEGKGITGGVGGGAEGAAGAAGGIGGGGVLATLGLIAGLLAVIAIGMTLISAFFDAVGPIIKVVMKMLSAMILILLMPFLKRGLPVLFDILKWMINMSKGLSDFVDKFLTYVEKLFGRAMTGDPMAFLELLIGPIGMLVLFLGKEIIKFLASVDWKAVVDAIVPVLVAAFEIVKEFVNKLGIAVFGEATWSKIIEGIKIIQSLFAPEGLWDNIKGVIDYIGTEIFGEGVWTTIKDALGSATDGVIANFISIRDKLGEILEGLINFYNTTVGRVAGFIAHAQTGGGGSSSISINQLPGGIPGYDAGDSSGESSSERDARVAGYISGGMASDFISRPGGGVQRFSPDDTIIGVKDPNKLGGGGLTINNTLHVSAGVDKNEFKKLLSQFSRQQARDIRTKTSYYSG